MKNTNALAIAGAIAIILNTAMLKLAKVFGIKAESGGLLKLTLLCLPSSISTQSLFKTDGFWFLFHFLTGAVMVVIYYKLFEQINLPVFWRGLLFSIFPWLINGIIVLPLLHQGILGLRTLPHSGIIYFFFANVIFGVPLACFYRLLTGKNHKC